MIREICASEEGKDLQYFKDLLDAVKEKVVFDFLLKKDEPTFHIGFGIDDKYCRCMGVSITSIHQNSSCRNLVFHIMAVGLDKAKGDSLKTIAQNLRIKMVIYKIDENFFSSLPSQVHLPISTYFRFLLPLLVREEKVLYVDADVLCLKNISGLFDLNIEKNIVAAVMDQPSLGMKRNAVLGLLDHHYFNAGVLLIDIVNWNRENVLNKVMTVLIKEPKKFRYLDQDALNLVLTGKVHYLDRKWNHLNNIVEGQEDSVFLHFAAHPKPWNIAWPISSLCTDFTRDLYHQYEQLTPWKDAPLEMPGNYKEMKVYAKCLWENGQYIKSIGWYVKYIIYKMKSK